MDYFVTKYGIEVASNLTKEEAIVKAKLIHLSEPEIGGIHICIGRIRHIGGKKKYNLSPYFVYLD